jgi:hypothetical protein
MAIEQTGVPRGPEAAGTPSAPGLAERLIRFDGPPQEFLAQLLAIQCQVAPAESGAILRLGAERQVELLALYPALPPGGVQPSWLPRAAAVAMELGAGPAPIMRPLAAGDDMYGQPARRHVVAVPLRSGPPGREVAVFVVDGRDASLVAGRLELSAALIGLYEMRLAGQKRQADLQRLRSAMETVAAVNEHDRFAGLAMALCNELASRWQADRVSLGFLKGRYIQLRAMSHTEKFSRKMKLVQDIESAMEECADQDVEISHPASPEATFVSRAAGELSRRQGPTSVLSLPLRHGGKAVAALVVERPVDKPFQLEEAESLRLAADLISPRLVNLEEHDRWIGARAVVRLRHGLEMVVGSKHTWIKVAAIVIAGFLGFATFAKGTYRVEAPFVLQPIEQQIVPAPFDGYLATVLVEPGQAVEGGKTVLATLETAELKLKLGEAKAEQAAYIKQADAAAALDKPEKTAEAQIARAQADRIAAQIDLLEYQIRRAEIISPTGGIVIAGDLKRQIGSPVKTGEALFEVAPIDSLRAELSVPNDEVADVELNQVGELATATTPDKYIKFSVERINPMSEIVERQNVFKVRVKLQDAPAGLLPGTEGLAKIDIGPHRYIWIWTRPIVKWVRMKLWL